jgi:hypothetical protein
VVVVVVFLVVAVWLLLLSLVAIRVLSASSISGGRSDLGWKKGVNAGVTTAIIIIANDTITNSDIKVVFFLLKITIPPPTCFQDS